MKTLLNYFKIKKLKKTQLEYQNKRPMFESFVVKSCSQRNVEKTFKGSFVVYDSFSQMQYKSQHPQKLLTLISSICEKHNLRFGQLIEIIKKEDWFYKKDEEIIELIENFLNKYAGTNSN